MKAHRVIGIDFGATNSSVAFWDDEGGEAVLVPTDTGAFLLPSVIGLDGDGNVIVGEAARDRLPYDPENTITGVKRLLGETSGVPFRGRQYLPQELVAFILAELKRMTEAYIGEAVQDAVITIPSYFTERQTGALAEAAAIAGLNVARFVSDASAAVTVFLGEGSPADDAHSYVIYDFGGSTLDITVVQVAGGVVTVVASGGDQSLGGRDFDDRIVQWALQQALQERGVDLSGDAAARARLQWQAEARKRQLSARDQTVVEIQGVSVVLPLTRGLFESLSGDLIERSKACLEDTIESARRKGIEPRRVLLVGGSARIPAVRAAISERMGGDSRAVRDGHWGEAAVARGAAILGRSVTPSDAGMVIGGLTSHALGLLVNSSDFMSVFPKGTMLPANIVVPGFTNAGPSTEIRLLLYQGEDKNALNNAQFAQVVIPLPAPRPAGYYRLEVTFELDARERLSVRAHSLEDGQVWDAIVESPGRADLWPRRLDDNVQFTVYRPAAVRPEQWATLLAFAHLAERRPDAAPGEPDPVEEVKAQAARILGAESDAYRQVTEDSVQPVPSEGELTFVPEIPGIEFNPPRRSFLWTESVHREEFRLRAPAGLEGSVARGRLTVFLGSLIIGDVPLAIRVGAVDRPERATSTARVYRKIFACYSHRDVAIVEECERYARATGDEYIRDMVHLRTGEVWDDRLRQMIDGADVFQLFWSSNSMRSEYARREWEHALMLRHKGEAFVRPVYWETPLPADPAVGLPPPDLERLHFQRLPIALPHYEREVIQLRELTPVEFPGIAVKSGTASAGEMLTCTAKPEPIPEIRMESQMLKMPTLMLEMPTDTAEAEHTLEAWNAAHASTATRKTASGASERRWPLVVLPALWLLVVFVGNRASGPGPLSPLARWGELAPGAIWLVAVLWLIWRRRR